MHFAMPPRKTSRPPPYAARNQSSWPIPPALKNMLRGGKLRTTVVGMLAFLALIWLLRGAGSDAGASIPKVAIGSGPPVVIVTTIDPRADAAWANKIRKNREDYAKKHGASAARPLAAAAAARQAILMISRVPDLLPRQQPVPPQPFSPHLGKGARAATRHVPLSRVDLLLVP